jgi:hypothetical protein
MKKTTRVGATNPPARARLAPPGSRLESAPVESARPEKPIAWRNLRRSWRIIGSLVG